jgi:hypothetical protein
MTKDKKNKTVRMTLGQFHQYTLKTQDSLKGNGRISDRLKARREGNVEKPISARVAGSKPAFTSLEVNYTTFPLLSNAESPDRPNRVSGAWVHGVQSILDAKNLPDPRILAEQERRAALKIESDRCFHREDENYSESESEPEPEPSKLASTGTNVSECSDEDWAEL